MTAPAIDKEMAQQARFAEAQRFAKEGLFRCRAGCNRVLPDDMGVQINHHGTVALAVCFDCLNRVDVVLSRGATGLDVKLRERGIIIVQT